MRISWMVWRICVTGIFIFTLQPCFGGTPRGERKERVKNSPHYHQGKFRNRQETPPLSSDKGFLGTVSQMMFKRTKRKKPKSPIPSVRTDLWTLDRSEDLLVWFGHSSYLLQVDGKRFLVDPVLKGAASPVWFINRPFKGTQVYKPEDIPEIDYLIISHDHFDHLDYGTIERIRDRVGKVICGLGAGQHLERWGFAPQQLVELDWNEEAGLDDGFRVYCLPARHWSGRGLKSSQSLWASYLLAMPSRKIYIGGDSGYDTHFAEIGERFSDIDLAILENGQYNQTWRYIHTLPEELMPAFRDLKAKRLFTVHHSKFALAKHPWDEPLKNVAAFAERDSVVLIQPMIGEVVFLNDSTYTLNKWWEEVE